MLRKLLIFIVLFVLLAAGVVRYGAPRYAEYRFKKYLFSADTLSYSYFDINLWKGSMEIRDLYLVDSSAKIMPQPIFLQIARISVSEISLRDIYFNHTIHADSLIIGKGSFSALQEEKLRSDEPVKNEPKEKKVNLPIYFIEVDNIEVDTLNLNLSFDAENRDKRASAVLNFMANGVHVNRKDFKTVNVDNIILDVRKCYYQGRNNRFFVEADSLSYHSKREFLEVNGVRMRQRIKKMKYAAFHGTDKVHTEFDLYRLRVKGLKPESRYYENGLTIPKIEILGPQFYLYKDKRYPHPKKPKDFPLEWLEKLSFPLHIDTIDVKDGQLFYQENWRPDQIPGHLDITDMNIRAYNVSNAKENKKRWAVVKGDITLFNELQINLDWQFDLKKWGRFFKLNMDIGPSDLKTLNPYTENTVNMRFRKGRILKGKMKVTADKKTAHGTLDLYYQDLHFDVLDKKDHEKHLKGWLAANVADIVIRNNNLPGKEPRSGKIYAEAEPDKAVFAFITKMFFAGLKDIAIGKKLDKTLEKQKKKKAKKTKKESEKEQSTK